MAEIGVCSGGWHSIAGSLPERTREVLLAGPAWYGLDSPPGPGCGALSQISPSVQGSVRALMKDCPHQSLVQCVAGSLQLMTSQFQAAYGTLGPIGSVWKELGESIRFPQNKWNKRHEVIVESPKETFARPVWSEINQVAALHQLLSLPIAAGRWSDHPGDERELDERYGTSNQGAIAKVQVVAVPTTLPIRLHEGALMWLPLQLARILVKSGCSLQVKHVKVPSDTHSVERYVPLPAVIKGIGEYSLAGQLSAGVVAWFLTVHHDVPDGVRWAVHAEIVCIQLEALMSGAEDSPQRNVKKDDWLWGQLRLLPGPVRAELFLRLGQLAADPSASADHIESAIRNAFDGAGYAELN